METEQLKPCSTCNGTGYFNESLTMPMQCYICNGVGKVLVKQRYHVTGIDILQIPQRYSDVPIDAKAAGMASIITCPDEYVPPLDAGIAPYVKILCELGVETFESCEGGDGHTYPEPTIRFHGDIAQGMYALSVAIEYGLPVMRLNRVWDVIDKEPVGPHWELVFWKKADGELAQEINDDLNHINSHKANPK